jgi:hypothetical protein
LTTLAREIEYRTNKANREAQSIAREALLIQSGSIIDAIELIEDTVYIKSLRNKAIRLLRNLQTD